MLMYKMCVEGRSARSNRGGELAREVGERSAAAAAIRRVFESLKSLQFSRETNQGEREERAE